jgi:pilus assembly protein FimV
MILPGVGALLALLGGLAFFRLRKKKGAGIDSSFLGSRLQPDSFFGASGGQRIDTNEASASGSGSSMVYSPSQLDAAGDVDPVAEADVYLAYGRDLQAEEILKEAMRSTPTRVTIHNKLLEIYAKRRDAKAFQVVATEAYALTQGQGPEWERACELGKELDPANPLYQPGGSPPQVPGKPGVAGAVFGGSTLMQHTKPGEANDSKLDLDLDFALEEAAAPAPGPWPEAQVSGMDDLSQTAVLTAEPAKRPEPAQAATFADGDVLTDAIAPVGGAWEPGPGEKSAKAPELLEFDLGELNLDLTPKAPTAAPGASAAPESQPETKLALAEEFRAIGDLEGARSLAEEVLAESTGPLRDRASRFLAGLA